MAMQPTDPADSTRAGQTGSFPFVPPPPGGPPTPAPFGPPPPAAPPPAFASGSTGAPTTTRIAVTNRILWIGQAAYPLANVARVGTSLIVPGRRRALLRLLAFALVVFLPVFVISQATGDSSSDSGSGGMVVGALILVAIYFLIFTWPVLRRPDLYVLAVDTAGPPTAVLAWLTAQPAFELQAVITRAIENPQAEFQQVVQSISVDLRQYQFGDSVNIYGGQGNTGVSK
ncbi:DUF6232 family protein [Kitasatospora sp. NPDC127067]|uniref:DUF6232 family protein n=1 Tax=Kitasatospora sp. NPDC127067 TaxID=3347126 RepID=UPI00364D3539